MLKYLVLPCVCLMMNMVLLVESSGNNLYSTALQNKLKQKIKDDLHKKRANTQIKSCESIRNWHPKVKSERFLMAGLDSSIISSMQSFPHIDNCTIEFPDHQDHFFEVTWRYEFFESMHCIKTELDFGANLTSFVQRLNYSYYGFTYRELGKKNVYMPRQLINESNNTLLIKNVNYHPYIVCVTFYKNPFVSQILPSVASDDDDLTCDDYSVLFTQDHRSHDVNLCIDIDTQATFLHDVAGGHGLHDSELLLALFYIFLIVVMFFIIAIGAYLIEKPKKKRYLDTVRKYISKKLDQTMFQNYENDEKKGERRKSFMKNTNNSGVSIVVSDYTVSSDLRSLKQANEEPNETDKLLITKPKITIIDETTHASVIETPVLKFHIDASIAEDISGEEDAIKDIEYEKTEANLSFDNLRNNSKSDSIVGRELMGLQDRRFSDHDMTSFKNHFNSLTNKAIGTDNLSSSNQ
jgi:hypothetical protein